jgi:hypothetical protein
MKTTIKERIPSPNGIDVGSFVVTIHSGSHKA